MDLHNILNQIDNMTRETEFEGEFIGLHVNNDPKLGLVVETQTAKPIESFMVRVGKPDIIRRRFHRFSGPTVIVEVFNPDDGKWESEDKMAWLIEQSAVSV